MEKKKVETVVQLCDELKKRANAWEKDYCSPMTSGALRRISMELTRALADMRRP